MDAIPSVASTTPLRNQRMREAAQNLEAQFLTTLLKEAGLGSPIEGFASGPGEKQFNSFLIEAQAQHIARNGGIGLAEMFFKALQENENEN